MSSQNKVSIQGLISAIANGINAGQQTDLFQKISDDLDKVFSQVNSGPLPENSAVNLKHLQASEIDGVIPRVNLPSLIAYDDVANPFTQDQTITKALATLFVKVVTPTKFGRVEAIADGRTLFSSNLSNTGAAFATDTGNGAGLEITDDNIKLRQRTAGVDRINIEVDTTGVIRLGNPASATGAAINEVVVPNSKSIRGTNNAGNTTFRMLSIDTNDTLLIGNGYNGDLFPKIIAALAANLPPSGSGATWDGTVCIDKTNHRLCFYEGGLRYFLAGTAF